MSRFWTNTIWYILLGILSLIVLFVAMIKAKDKGPAFAFFLTMFGLTLNFESIIFIFMKSYVYYPCIIKNPPLLLDDMLAGNLFSQFAISATILLVVVLKLKYYWYFILSGVFGLVEELFLVLGIYKHNWYETWITVVAFSCLCWLAEKMYSKLIIGMKPILYYFYIFLALFPLVISILIWFFILLRYQTFNTSLFHDAASSRSFLVLIYFNFFCIPIMYIYFLKSNWTIKLLIVIAIYTVYYIGYKLNLIFIRESRIPLAFTATILWVYFSVFITDKLYGGYKQKISQ